MSDHDTIDIARRRSTEDEVPLEKHEEKDVHLPVDDQVTILGTGDDSGHELATKA
jgi:hypothetical protein